MKLICILSVITAGFLVTPRALAQNPNPTHTASKKIGEYALSYADWVTRNQSTQSWDYADIGGGLTLEVRTTVNYLGQRLIQQKVKALFNIPTPGFLEKWGVTRVAIGTSKGPSLRPSLPKFVNQTRRNVGVQVLFIWGHDQSETNPDGKFGMFIR